MYIMTPILPKFYGYPETKFYLCNNIRNTIKYWIKLKAIWAVLSNSYILIHTLLNLVPAEFGSQSDNQVRNIKTLSNYSKNPFIFEQPIRFVSKNKDLPSHYLDQENKV